MANTTSLTGLSKDILRKKYILEGFRFYLETLHPEYNKLLLESNNSDVLLEGLFDKISNSLKSFKEKNIFRNLVTAIGILFKENPDPKFRELLQGAFKEISNKKISSEEIKNTFSGEVSEAEINEAKGIIQSLKDYLDNKGRKLKNAVVGVLMLASVAATYGSAITNFITSKFGKVETAAKKNSYEDELKNKEGTVFLNNLSQKGAKITGGEPPTDDNTAVVDNGIPINYNTAELDDEAKGILDDLASKITQTIEDGNEAEIEVGGTDSNTTGEDDIGGLKNKRANNIIKYLEEKLKDTLGNKFSKVKITKVTTTDPDEQKQEPVGGEKDTADGEQKTASGGIVRTKVPIKGDVTLGWKNWPEAIEREVSGRLTEPDGETPRTGGETPRTGEETPRAGGETPRTKRDKKSKTDVPPTPSTEFSKLNRNGQIATVLAAIDPKLNIAQYKEIGPIKSYSDRELLNPEIKDANAKELGRLIVTMRKNPDATLKKISTATGVSLKRKAKVRAKKQDNTIQSQEPSTINESRELFLEAAIDDIFTKLGVQDDTINKNKDKVISYLKAMYASDESNDLDVIDKNKSKTIQADTKRALDVIASRQKELQPYFDRISNKQEFADFIVGIIKFVEEKLQQDASKLRSAFFRLRNNLKEAEEGEKIQIDAQRALEKIQKNTFLVQALGKISNLDELEQFLAGVITYITKVNTIDKKNALIVASNVLTSDANKGPRSKTTEIQRMQELAGLKK